MPAVLVLHRRRTARHALDVLAGAVEATPAARDVPQRFAASPGDVVAAVRDARAAGRRAVVAWSFYTASFAEVAAELAAVRAALGGDDGVLHVAGGPHPSADPAGTLRAGFGLVGIGEGEETLPAVVARVAAGEDPRAAPGLAWLEGERLRTSGRAPPVALDAFPPCAPAAGRIGPIELTRGCVWACRFCATPYLFRARFRHRSVPEVARWARFLAGLGARDLRFLTPSALSYGADDAAPNLDAVEALLAAVREAVGSARRVFFGTFPSELRPEHVSPRALALVRRFCDNRTIILGAQSGSERVLAALGRGHGPDAVERAVRLACESGFGADVDFVFGLPGEDDADRAASRAQIARLTTLGARVHAHAFMPLPGTPWSSAAPGAIDPETAVLLERLASGGRAYGQWKAQAAVARRGNPPPRGRQNA